jgi:hypothetical protein
MRRGIEYLVMWDKPGTRSAPGRFYRGIISEFGNEVRFIQRSVYGVKTIDCAQRLAELAKHYRLKVAIFMAEEIPFQNGVD